MTLLQIAVLAVVQGMAELLPVSSSAHVIVAEKLMGLDPTTPQMTLLLVMLHTGTMFAVMVYFWGDWKNNYFQSAWKAWAFLRRCALATLATGVLGLALMLLIEKVILKGSPNAEVESLFGNMGLIAVNLALVGFLILFASFYEKRAEKSESLGYRASLIIGLVQGLCLPLRGFSRSGATISTGLILGLRRSLSEEFSFALAVILTPPVIVREFHRLLKSHSALGLPPDQLWHAFYPSLIGMVLSFLAGLLALKWLSSWLQRGRWGYFGFYCLFASGVVAWLFLFFFKNH
jgi:undecaprenyl-diphosphatase